MKTVLLIIISMGTSNFLIAQPWKIEHDFKIAFDDSYADYRLVREKKNNRILCIGFSKKDSLKRLFEFQTLLDTTTKDGWFNQVDTSNRQSFSIYFVKGEAKKLSYTNVDNLVFTFSIDSNLLNGVHTVYYGNGNIKEYGFYKNNARGGEWRFYNTNGVVVSEGNFGGDYKKIVYDAKKRKLITLNKYLDIVKVEQFDQKKYDSLKKVLNQRWGLLFPIHLHYKIGAWKYYDNDGKLIKREIYDNGKLIKVEKN